MTEGSIFDILRKQYDNKLPFVAYRKPDEQKGTVFLQDSSELFTSEDFLESGFIFAPFDDRRQVILIPEDAAQKHIFDTSVVETSASSAEGKTLLNHSSEATKEQHVALVKKGLEKLTSGELEKVVLSRKEQITLENADPVSLFRELLQNYPTAFVYLWYHPKVGCWLAATPETLLKVEGNSFKTMALAGTQKFNGSTDVIWGEKEKQEQLFVTDSILENLERVGVPSSGIKKSNVYTAKAGSLLHLRTDISGRLHDPKAGLRNIISALHPTPAVCGLPKEKAKEFILSEEGYDREFYTGFLGELNLQKNIQRSRNRRNVENLAYRTVKHESALFVNLRCMKLEVDHANIFVGGGITKDSNPEAEWEETVNKAQTMKKVLFK